MYKVSVIVPVYNVEKYIVRCDDSQEEIESKMRQSLVNYGLMHDFIVKNCQLEENSFIFKKVLLRGLFFRGENKDFREEYLRTFPEINLRLLFVRGISLRFKLLHLLVLLGLYQAAMDLDGFIRNMLSGSIWSGGNAVPRPTLTSK